MRWFVWSIWAVLYCAPVFGSTWTQVQTDTAPSPRYDFGMAYDERREVTVLFGGLTIAGEPPRLRSMGDLWEWDGEAWTQREFQNGPPRSYGHRMCFDPSRGAVVVAGGQVSRENQRPGTWAWDGEGWSSITQDSPGAIRALAFDPAAEQLVALNYTGDTHVLIEGEWREVDEHDWSTNVAMASGGDDRLFLFVREGSRIRVWLWRGSRWSARSGGRAQIRLDQGSFANVTGVISTDTCWYVFGDELIARFDGRRLLRQERPNRHPWMRRRGYGVVYDRARNQLVLFGGHTGHELSDTGIVAYSDTWIFDEPE